MKNTNDSRIIELLKEIRNISENIFVLLIVFGIMTCTNVTRAEDCPKPVQTIKKGQTANCDGFLFSDKAEKQASEARDDKEYFDKLVPKLQMKINLEEQRNDILEQRLTLYMKQSQVLAEDRVKSDNRIFFERVGMFLLGAAVMYGAADLAR